MTSTKNTQSTLLGEPASGGVEIETDGRFIRPFLSVPSELVDEGRLVFTKDGVRSSAVDPPNVGLYELFAPASAFDQYDLQGEEFTVGIDFETAESYLRDARMGTKTADTVAMSFSGTTTRYEITRDYRHCTVERTDEFLNIDPDMIRASPDIPDDSVDWSAVVDVGAFADVVGHIDEVSDHVALRESGGSLVMSAQEKNTDGKLAHATRATFADVAESNTDDPTDGAESLYSLDYLKDMASGIKAAKADAVTLRWHQEYPLFMEFERTDSDGELLYEGRYMVAPRLKQDDD